MSEEKQLLSSEKQELPVPVIHPRERAVSWRSRVILALGIAACSYQLFTAVHRPHRHHHRHAHKHLDTEKYALNVPTPEGAKKASEAITFQTHLAGTRGDLDTVLHLKGEWEHLLGLAKSPKHSNVYESGSRESREALTRSSHGRHHQQPPRVWVDTYHTMMTYPVSSSLKALNGEGTTVYQAKLVEDVVPEDKTSKKGRKAVPTFHGFSKNGTARGQLVYAGTGSKAEFDELAKTIDFKGKIALVTYGGVFRGLKVKAAAEAGAAGCLIYTDPIEDGEVTARNGYKTYPDGPARQPSSVQRGSTQYLSYYAGDPLTPGVPAHKDAKRISRDDPNINVPSIPSLPISGEAALPLLRMLAGKGAKSNRPGAFDVEYWTGPTEEEIEMVNHIDEVVTPIWNTMAVIPGRQSDEVVCLGNHHDAWTFGSGDPNSGTASVHEVIKTLGRLLKDGWRPARTILLAAWDGEELGLLGSTEFVEDHTEWLREHIVAYLNVDVSVAGSNFGLGASPSMADLFMTAAGKVQDPDQKNRTLADKMQAHHSTVEALGSGSDFTGFLQYAGLASGNIGFSRTRTDPVYHYHSIYDSAYWMRTFGDPTFERHAAVSKMLNLVLLGLVDSPIVPLNVAAYARELHGYVAKLPESSLDLTALNESVDELVDASESLIKEADDVKAALNAGGCHKKRKHAWHRVRSINKRLRSFENGFIDQGGLPGREWYKNLVVAPGRLLGYGATTLPGVAEALKLDHDEQHAQVEVDRLIKAFKHTAAMLRSD